MPFAIASLYTAAPTAANCKPMPMLLRKQVDSWALHALGFARDEIF